MKWELLEVSEQRSSVTSLRFEQDHSGGSIVSTLKEGKERYPLGGYRSDPVRDDGSSGWRKSRYILHIFYIRYIADLQFYS